MLLPQIERHADKVAFIDGEYRATFAQHIDRVARLSHALAHQLGIGKEDRFAVLALNSHQYEELWHAAFLGAGIMNPLNLRLAAPELEYILKNSGTKVVFTDFLFANVVEQVREAAGIEQVVLIGDLDGPHDVKYEDLIAAGEPVLPDEPDEDDPVVLMYTGGTTGLPKGVLLDQRAEMLNLYHVAMLFGLDENIINLNQTPMFHAATMGGILGVPAAGGTSTFVSMFDPVRVLDTMEAEKATWTVMVPTMIGLVLNHPEFRPERMSSLEVLVYGASPMPTVLLERLLSMYPDLRVYQGYGMTEASAVLTVLGPEEHRSGGSLLRSAGRAVPGASLTIRDSHGAPVATGETGEVWARAGNFMREYWGNPEATEEAFAEDWYHTGDAGYLDAQGYLYLVDRVKDMVITGGENVYSSEVENAIATHEAVAQVAVIGIPDPKWGEAVHAIVVLNEGSSATEDEIREWAKTTIAGYKVPKSIEFRAEPLPLSGAMKVLKRELRQPYWGDHDRGVG